MRYKLLKLFWLKIENCVRTIIFRQNYFSNFTILINFYIGLWLVVWFGRGSDCGHVLNQWLTTSIERLNHFEPYGLTAVGPLFTSCPSIFPNKLSSVNDIPSSYIYINLETLLRNTTSNHNLETLVEKITWKQAGSKIMLTLFPTDVSNWVFRLMFPTDVFKD